MKNRQSRKLCQFKEDMTKPSPLTVPAIIGVLPAFVLFAGMVAGFTSLKADVAYIKEKVEGIASEQQKSATLLTNHEVRITVLESKKTTTLPKTVTIASVPQIQSTPHPVQIKSEVIIHEESQPAPEPAPEPSSDPHPLAVLPSPIELVRKVLR